MNITQVRAIEILDSRGKPTIRTFITLGDGSVHSASVPSGASTGSHEAHELRDNDPSRYAGNGVLKAVDHVNTKLNKMAVGRDVTELRQIDEDMIALDGTDLKSALGANAILSVSLAAHRAAAASQQMPLWKFLHEYYMKNDNNNLSAKSYPLSPRFPRLMVNIVNGGKHAGWNFDIQEFMVMPKTNVPTEAVRIAAEIFGELGNVLKQKNLSRLVGDEGGYSPALSSNEAVFETIEQAAKNLGYVRNNEYEFAVDCAASEFCVPADKEGENNQYHFKKTNETKSAQELMTYYSHLGQKYNIQSFEDPFAEDDWEAFTAFTGQAEQFHFQVVGDDIFVTDPTRIQKGIETKAANAVLIKVNQIGTIGETIQAIQMTQKAGWKVAISHRSGETEDPFIADLAYAVGADFIKTGSMSRSERLAKYNRLIEIEAGL